MFADAFGALNSTGVDLSGTGIIFDGWDTGTPGSLAEVIQAPGVRAIVSSYCFLAPTQSCPDNLPGGATPNWFTNINCEIQNKSLFPPEAWSYLDNIIGGHPSRWGEQACRVMAGKDGVRHPVTHIATHPYCRLTGRTFFSSRGLQSWAPRRSSGAPPTSRMAHSLGRDRCA